MLIPETARDSMSTDCFVRSQITSPSFESPKFLWDKSKPSQSLIKRPELFDTPHKNPFIKYGKTFGIQTTRFLEFKDGIIYYFDNQNDKQCKGSCKVDNLYMDYSTIGNKYAMHLSNGFQATSFYFPNINSYKLIEQKICKEVVQINFNQKYTISNLLGEGTFSKVYLAKKNGKTDKFAVKIVPKIDSTGFPTKHIIQEQRKILRHLKSDLICKMEQFFQDNNNYLIILEYLTGKDLNCIFKESKQLSLNEIKFILKQILQSLAYIHKMNIIHRDIKPHNIIVDLEKKKVKLIDFGLSLMYSPNTNLEKFMRCGTMGYIAPEVVNNSQSCRKKYDTKSDIFGFGIIAHMLLMGRNPLKGKTYKETIDNNLLGQITLDRSEIVSKYGQSCFQLLKSLLQKDPKLRASAESALNNQFFKQSSADNTRIIKSSMKNDDEINNKQTNYLSEKEQKQNIKINQNKPKNNQINKKTKHDQKSNNNSSTKTSSKSPHKFSGIH